MNAQNFFQKRKGADLSKIVYPTVILITGWYAVVNIYQIFTRQGDIVYTVVWALVPIAFVYLLLTGTKLKFRWSILSLIGMIMAGLFAFFVLLEIFSPHFDRKAFFFSGLWDHYLWPIAFGLFFLCDLRNLPKLFWLLLSPFAFFCLILGNLAFLTHTLFGKSIIPDFPGILVFWAVSYTHLTLPTKA